MLGVLAACFQSLGEGRRSASFLDPFAGSGAVSRLARVMGYRVHANDWEPFSYIINLCYVGVQQHEADALLAPLGGLQRAIATLNAAPHPTPAEEYVARHYAPRVTAQADFRRERLFFTREAALRIDALRGWIARNLPAAGRPGRRARALLLAPLLWETATRSNTSGVFKGFHKGFGGYSGDALGRILRPFRPPVPVLTNSLAEASISCLEAGAFLRRQAGDVCYLDPPYNQHQYASNYHLLNSVALWDRAPVNDEVRDGWLVERAGIRTDWRERSSPFCSRRTAAVSLRGLLDTIDAGQIVLSYGSAGLVSCEEVLDLMAGAGGRVAVLRMPQVVYRGGRRSPTVAHSTTEALFILDRRSHARGGRPEAERQLALARVGELESAAYVPSRVRQHFMVVRETVRLHSQAQTEVSMPGLYRFAQRLPDVHTWPLPQIRDLVYRLEASRAATSVDELEVVFSLLERTQFDGPPGLERRAAVLLRRFASAKHAAAFASYLARAQRLTRARPQLRPLARRLPELAQLAHMRQAGVRSSASRSGRRPRSPALPAAPASPAGRVRSE